MTNIISLESRLKKKMELETKVGQVKENTLSTEEKNKDLLKKLKSRKTLTLSSEEILFLIKHLATYIEDIPSKLEDAFIIFNLIPRDETPEEIDKEKESLVKKYREDALWGLRTLEKLIKKFYESDYMLDKKVQITVSDADNFWSILSGLVDYEIDRDELYKNAYHVKDYEFTSTDDKILKYLFKVFRDIRNEAYFADANLKSNEDICNTLSNSLFSEMKKHYDDYEDAIEYFYDSYVKEFKSDVTLIHEGTFTLTMNDKPLGNSYLQYFIKPNPVINKRLAKYKRDFYPNSEFNFWDELELEDQKEFTDNPDAFSRGIGFRITLDALTYEQFEEDEEYMSCDGLNEGYRLYTLKHLNTLEEFKGLNVEIVFSEDLDEKFYDNSATIERVIDSLEDASLNYTSSGYFAKDELISHKIDAAIDCFYK